MTTRQLNVFSGGRWFDMNDRQKFYLQGIQGLEDADVNRFWEQGPLQNGATDTGFQYRRRVFDLIFTVSGCDSCSFAQSWREFRRVFGTPNAPLILDFTEDDGTVRRATAHKIDQIAGQRQGHIRRTVVSFALDEGIGLTNLNERQVEITFPGAVSPQIKDIYYAGEWLAPVIIEIDGPANGFSIVNTTINEQIFALLSAIPLGGKRIINTSTGLMVDENGVNKNAEFAVASAITEWVLVPEGWYLPNTDTYSNGVNSISAGTISGGIDPANTKFTIKYFDQYLTI